LPDGIAEILHQSTHLGSALLAAQDDTD
jgi:hypothetical protein